MNTIYAIQINKLSFGVLKILDIKIGMTINIKNTLAGYRRSSPEAELLNLWEANSSQALKICETGVHLIAEKYAYQRKGEKFIFLQNNYDDFAKNISLLLKEITALESISLPLTSCLVNKKTINIFGTTHGKKYYAQLINLKKVKLNGKIFNSPSAAALSICGYLVNGRDFWKFISNGKTKTISGLRSKK